MTQATDEAIHATLSGLLLTGALPAGTQLVETRVAAIFGVSRERVRKVLHRLGHERLLEMVPNRGSFVRAPSLEQAREIYAARRVTEGGIVAWLAAQGLATPQLDTLRRHLAAEEAAAAAGDRAASVRLSGEFHLLLAQATGNALVEGNLRELVSRTALLVALFEQGNASHCGCEEHRTILAELERSNVTGALGAMHAHLSLIETRLRPRGEAAAVDADAVLRKAWKATTGRSRKAAPA